MRFARFTVTLILLALAATAGSDTSGNRAAGVALRLEVRGAIGPATSDYIVKGIQSAADRGARVVILEMDTPGGLDASMRDIIKAILASAVPVITFVAPSGSRAASAGTYILYASHVAAMAPATNLGAATPVQIGGGPEPAGEQPAPPRDRSSADEKTGPAPDPGNAHERKAVNDGVAYIQGLANLRGRNAEWAERAVRSAASLSAEAARADNVIDVVARDIPELLRTVDGRVVRVADREVTLDTGGLSIEHFDPDWRTRLLETITDPNVAYLLMLIGIFGLIFEGYNPGAVLPGVVGAIALLLALFAFQMLSVNYAGIALIALGTALIVAEAFVPSFGALGIGGIAAFVFGSIILIDTPVPGLEISRPLIGSVALVGSLALLGMIIMIARIRNRPAVSGAEGMIGETGEALEDFTGHGAVFVHGERWKAHAKRPVRKGDPVRVTGIRGLLLEVEPETPR